jgi:hypothetical protein
MGVGERSGSLSYTEDSGSYYVGSFALWSAADVRQDRLANKEAKDYSQLVTTTITESLTIKYFQRVFDAGLSVYCYYTKTSIDPTPLSTETSPEYTGAISDHSVVKILEIY